MTSEHPATRWDVYRDEDGNPVTITEQQMHAIWHAIRVVDDVRRAEGCRSFDDQAKVGNWHAELYKSRLLGRMLLDGKPPYDEKPPTEVAACAYWLWDDEDEEEVQSAAGNLFPGIDVSRIPAPLLVGLSGSKHLECAECRKKFKQRWTALDEYRAHYIMEHIE